MFRRLLGIMIFIPIFFMMPSDSEANAQTIQQMIDEATVGETIEIPEGIYKEPIIIHKQINLIGNEHVQFHVKHEKPAITIQADGVTLQHISVKYSSDDDRQAAIFIQSSRNNIEHVHIETSHRGIFLDDAHNNTLDRITLQGDEQLPIQMRQRGIDLWKSSNNTIKNSHISFVEDGIYIESSAGNVLHHNITTDSRYGYHLMFTRETELFANESYENISGMMIMGTKGTKVYENILNYNQKNVQSLGLLLFDVQHALVERNEIAHNRIGIFVEDASENEITNNDVKHNFIGLQFKRAEKNIIHHNAFSANVVQGQAEDSMNNNTNNNFWSNHKGLDMTGDDVSNLIYKVDPFYLHLTNKYPPYRLLFQSPGFVFLETMLHTPVEQQLVDETPLMKIPLDVDEETSNSNWTMLIISTILFILSLFIIYSGVKQ